MMRDAEILAAIDALYAAALDPAGWPKALDAIARATGALGTSLIPLGIKGQFMSTSSASIAEADAAYQAFWWQHDTPTQRVFDRGLKPGVVGTDRFVVSEEEARRDPFYQEFWRRHGIGQSLATVVSAGPERLACVACVRPLGAELVQQEELDTLKMLSSHIGRAVSISAALMEARQMSDHLAAAVERLAWGVVLLGPTGRATYVNAVAQGMLGSAFDIVRGRPRARTRADDALLQRAIGTALPPGEEPPSEGFLMRAQGGADLVFAEVVPVRPRQGALEVIALGGGGAMLLVRRISAEPRSVVAQLRQLGLTPAEAQLAEALGQGESLRNIAGRRGIAYETARTHLRGVFRKLGMSRQAELAALVVRLMSGTAR